MCSYTSSDSTTMPVSRTIAASSSRSAADSTAPDGLCGLLIMIMRVFGVTASRTRCQSIANAGTVSGTCTARAPCRSIAGS